MSEELHRIEWVETLNLTEKSIRSMAKSALSGPLKEACRAWVAEQPVTPEPVPEPPEVGSRWRDPKDHDHIGEVVEFRPGHGFPLKVMWEWGGTTVAPVDWFVSRFEPIAPAEPVPEARQEWSLVGTNPMGYDPDWVQVRPCDLQPGDRIAWGDGEREVEKIIEHQVEVGCVRVVVNDGRTIRSLESWSPVLVRRGGTTR